MFREYSVQAGGRSCNINFFPIILMDTNLHLMKHIQISASHLCSRSWTQKAIREKKKKTENQIKFFKKKGKEKEKVQHVCHCTVNNYLNGRLGLKIYSCSNVSFFLCFEATQRQTLKEILKESSWSLRIKILDISNFKRNQIHEYVCSLSEGFLVSSWGYDRIP